MLGTVGRVGMVLELFTQESPEWGVSEVAKALGIPRTTAHELLSSLAQIGLLHRMSTGRYKLGFRLLSLAQTLLANTPWRDVAHREMVRLHACTGAVVQLAAYDGGALICLEQNPAPMGFPLAAGWGVHCSALGKVMLAGKPDKALEGLLELPLQARTPCTITAPEELRSEILRVRTQGYAYEIEEQEKGFCAVAAPIRNHNAEVIAALGLRVATEDFHRRKWVLRDAVMHSAQDVSLAIGYDPSHPFPRWHLVQGQERLVRS